MGAFGLIELEGAGEAFDDAVRDTTGVPALEAGVVVDADPGEQRDLLPAEARDPAVTPVVGQAGLLRGDLRPARRQELTEVGPVVHTSRLRAHLDMREGLPVPRTAGPATDPPSRV